MKTVAKYSCQIPKQTPPIHKPVVTEPNDLDLEIYLFIAVVKSNGPNCPQIVGYHKPMFTKKASKSVLLHYHKML